MVIKQIYLYKPADTAASRLHVPVPMTGAIAVLTAAVFFVGLYPTPLFKAIEHSTAMLFPGT